MMNFSSQTYGDKLELKLYEKIITWRSIIMKNNLVVCLTAGAFEIATRE